MTDIKTDSAEAVEEPKITEDEMVGQLELSSVIEATEKEARLCLNGIFRQMMGAVDTNKHPNAKRMNATELLDVSSHELLEGAGIGFAVVPSVKDAATGMAVSGKAFLSVVVREHEFDFSETVLSRQINVLNEIRSRVKGNKFIDKAYETLYALADANKEEQPKEK